MPISVPCTHPVPVGVWTRLGRRLRRLVGARGVAPGARWEPCGATAAQGSVCGVCGLVQACCDAHGGVMGMFKLMHQHLDTHHAPEGTAQEGTDR